MFDNNNNFNNFGTKRHKRFHTKVFTGCKTCRQRRVKCGEEKPVCRRCENVGRECVYDLARVNENEMISLRLKRVETTPGDDNEKRALLFYREKTAPLYGGDYNTFVGQIFNELFLTVATSNPIVWHLAVALGSRHEAKENSDTSSALTVLASKHYGQALNEFSQRVVSLKVDEALLCCVLMAGYANTAAEVPGDALLHLIFGATILRQALPNTPHAWQYMSEQLEPLYAHLAMTSCMFAVPPIDTQCDYLVTPKYPVLPTTISDLRQAKSYFVDILRWRCWHSIGPLKEEQHASEADSTDLPTKHLLNEWHELLLDFRNSTKGLTRSRASNMLYHFELLCAHSKPSRTLKLMEMTDVRLLRIDLSQNSRIDVIFECGGAPPPSLKQSINNDSRTFSADASATLWPFSVLIDESEDKSFYRLSHVK